MGEGETVKEGALEAVSDTVDVVEEEERGVKVGKDDKVPETVGERESVEEAHFDTE